MFVQIIEGRTSDAEGVRRQFERWQSELRPGADGFLGSTSGVTADGRAITLARFESEEAARANSERREQGSWWSETEKYYDGDVLFEDSTDVQEFRGGGSDDAGFVQVMRSTGVDRDATGGLDAEFERHSDFRPDLLGMIRVWTGADSCVEVAYFTSETEAREGEQTDLPEDVRPMMEQLEAAMGDTEYYDLTDPHLF